MKCPRCQADLSATDRVCPHCGAPADPTLTVRPEGPDIRTGAMIGGRYLLLEELGSGGMGEVFLAEQREPVRRRVALKVIKLGMDTRQVVARFEMERQALAVMDHPNIARVFDAGATETGRPYFVMELVRGIPITDYCDKNKLPARARLALFGSVCRAVQHAHQKGVIHRDLKPSNILVVVQDGLPVPKIIDFGIAKATDRPLVERTLFTEQGQMIGTPEYMSPEQAEMSALDVDTRTDIYSLGVVLYEILAGALPFDPDKLRAAGLAEIQRVIRETEPPRASTRLSALKDTKTEIAVNRATDPRSLVRLLRGDLDWITMKAMAKDRTRRYSSASELAADIDRYLSHEPVSAGPPSAMYKARKYVRRHRWGVAAAAVVVAAVLLGSAGTTIGLVRAVRAEKRAVEEAATSRQVSDFLVDLFRVSDPGKARGNTVTAREILDAGAGKIEKDLSGQPAVQARLMETMGTVYRSLGLYPQAQDMLEKALRLLRGLHGERHLFVADALHNLGIVQSDQSRLDEAGALFREAVDIRTALLGPADPETGRSLNSLASVLWSQGKFAEAEPLFERSLAVKEKALGPDDPALASTLMNLGVLKHSQRKFGEAEAFFKRALAISEKALGPDHPDVATMLNNLGSLYEDQGRRTEAEPVYVRALAIWEKALGPDHPDVGIAVHNLANLYRNTGRPERAEPLYLRSLAIWEKALGADHPYVANSLRERANMYRDLGRYAEAEPLYLRSLRIFDKRPDEQRNEIVETLTQYVLLLRKTGRTKDAGPYEDRLKALQVK